VPNGNDSKPIPQKESTQPPSPPAPVVPANNEAVLPERDKNPRQEQINVTVNTPSQTRAAEWLQLGINAVLAVVGVIAICIYGGELNVMRQQFTEMSRQTAILNSQAQQAAQDSLAAAGRVERQLNLSEKQVKAAQDQVDAIKKQMHEDQRPWVLVDLNLPPETTERNNVILGGPLGVAIKINNTGKTIARDVKAYCFVEIVKPGEKLALNHPQVPPFIIASGAFSPNTPIIDTVYRLRWTSGKPREWDLFRNPSDLRPEDKDVEPLRLTEADPVNNWLSVHGEITYSDIFNVNHWTKFCWLVGGRTGTNALTSKEECVKYNDVDKN
jgi:hypothetical protein